MKRANGTGSVYKMKHKKLRNPYRAVITVGYTKAGKAIRKTIGHFPTQKEAYAAIESFNLNPVAAIKRKVTFDQCFDWLIEQKKREGVTPERLQVIESARKLMAPLLDAEIENIRLAHIQHIFDGFTYKKSYQTNIKTVLGMVGDIAVKNKVIEENIFKDIFISKQAEGIKRATIFTPEELLKLWDDDSETAHIMLVYIYTGLRLNEWLNMRVDNIYLKERYMIGGSKSEAGRDRTIPIAECIYPIIRDFYQSAKFRRVECIMDGITSVSLYRKAWKAIHERLELSYHKPHDTRHTFITMCSNADVPELIIKNIVGHSSGRDVTNSVYIHKTTEQLIAAVNMLPTRGHLEKVEQRLSNRIK